MYDDIDSFIPRERPRVRVRGHFVLHDAVPMTKEQIIMRREEALRMHCPMIIFDEAGEVTPEMWSGLDGLVK